MTGFESVGKAAEEASPEFRAQGFYRAIWMAIFVGILFYASIVAAVAFVAPWQQLTGEKFMTAVAFQQALGARWIVNIILAAALLSLFKCFNGNFVAASRLFFALGRRGMVDSRVGTVHARISDSIRRGPLCGSRHRRVHAAGRRDPRARHRGRIRCLRRRLVGNLRRVPGPCRRPAEPDHSVVNQARSRPVRIRSGNRNGPDESSPPGARPFHTLRMDRPGRVDRYRSHRSRSFAARRALNPWKGFSPEDTNDKQKQRDHLVEPTPAFSSSLSSSSPRIPAALCRACPKLILRPGHHQRPHHRRHRLSLVFGRHRHPRRQNRGHRQSRRSSAQAHD